MVPSNSLRNSVSQGLLWGAVEKLSSQILQFAIGIVLARLLLPKDFGLLGMLSVFMAISNVFINSGLSTGLIQKQLRSDDDFSTVFIFNLFVSIFFYTILFFTAPLIAGFFEQPLLVILTRVTSFGLIIDSLSIVQRAKLTIALDFKTIARINILSTLISGIVSISSGLLGFGIWALVVNGFVFSITSLIALNLVSKWKPNFVFSIESFRALFGYGSKLLITGIFHQIIQNVYNVIIGKFYNPTELGYFTKAKSYAEISSTSINNVLQQVTFPLLASMQNDKDQLMNLYKRMISLSCFVIFPFMTIIALLAKTLVIILLTEKWSPVIPLLQWYVFSRLFYPIGAVNMNILNATGRSDLFMRVELLKFPILLIALALTIPFGIKALVIGAVISSLGYFFINSYFPGKIYGYGSLSQLRDIAPIVLSTTLMALISLVLIKFIENTLVQLMVIPLVSIALYLGFSCLLRIKEFDLLKELAIMIKNKLFAK